MKKEDVYLIAILTIGQKWTITATKISVISIKQIYNSQLTVTNLFG